MAPLPTDCNWMAVYVIDMDSITETRIDRRKEADLGEVLRGLEEFNA